MNKKNSQLLSVVIVLVIAFLVTNNDSSKVNSLEKLYKSETSGVMVTFEARVIKILSDDVNGSKHQRLILKNNDITVLLAHNIDVAERVPVKTNDTITVKGQYEWSQKGGTVHWTHKKDNSPHGWVMFNNKKYH